MLTPDAKLKFLQDPNAYGDAHLPVESIETHMSWVFLVGPRVFKLKKSVCLPFVDFTSLDAREFYCKEEVRLNARMAPGIYLGVVALQWLDGTFALVPETDLCARGETVDWLVLMRRLPLEHMLHKRITTCRVSPADIDSLAEVLIAFYQSAPVSPLSSTDYIARFKREQPLSSNVLLRPTFQLRDAALAISRLGTALDDCENLLCDRVHQHRIIEGHGDLRADHVCLLPAPVVIDCLEFNPQMRQVDPFDELAYLGLECDMAGAAWIGGRLLAGVANTLHDHPLPNLMHFYTAHRAVLRARLAMAHLLEPQPRTPQIWKPLAERYIARALAAIDAFTVTIRHGTT